MPRKKKSELAESFQNFTPYKAKKGEEYMGEPQKDHFRDILLNWKGQLMEEVDRTVTHMQDEAANFPDPADRATQEEPVGGLRAHNVGCVLHVESDAVRLDRRYPQRVEPRASHQVKLMAYLLLHHTRNARLSVAFNAQCTL